ncbi:hypothetical protein BG46_01430 [Brucella anthropi]|uniref:hypothetical protein n=1 Tax=Brucella anthropi TaxID=529 RepID=UPI00044D2543|nr:hypothetical protein [Brucella anthropi]EXL08572.1 hypothetical protein BG46_01430 [Brucella anthropi]
MIRRSLLFVFCSLPAICLAFAAGLAFSFVAVPLMYLLKTLVAHPVFNILHAIKLIAFRVIEQLKPVYRLSFLTYGRSLLHRRCFA